MNTDYSTIRWRVRYQEHEKGCIIQWGETSIEDDARRWLRQVRDLYPDAARTWAEKVEITENIQELDW